MHNEKESFINTNGSTDDDGNVYDILCGPFFVCGLSEDDFASLPEDMLRKYAQRFQHPELFLRIGESLMVVPF